MEQIVIEASKREELGKRVKLLRREGVLPAVVYGREVEAIPISLDLRQASKILAGVSSSTLVVIKLDKEEHTTLVRERQRDVLKGTLLHVDFQAVSMTETIRADVSVVLEGESPAVKSYGALLVTGLEQLSVESLPQDLPERVIVDVSSMEEIGDTIYVKDIALPPNVELVTDPEELLVVVSAPVEELEEEVIEEEVLEEGVEPEVIEKGLAEDEEGEEQAEEE